MGAGYRRLADAMLNTLAILLGVVGGALLAALLVLALVYWGL
jgi:hypothetical protein